MEIDSIGIIFNEIELASMGVIALLII